MALRVLAGVLLLAFAGQVQHASAQDAAAPTATIGSNIPPLPPLTQTPDGCGAVAQVVPGWDCHAIA